MKVLCVAEKPSIAKAVAGILGGRFNTRDSRLKWIKNYDFNFDFGGSLGKCQVTMTSVLGNLLSHQFPQEYNWGHCQPFELFDCPVTYITDTNNSKLIYQNILKESKNCDKLMIWTDCDREGESIGYQIFEAASKGNRNIKFDKVLRAQFSHLERNHILQAAKSPRNLDMKLVNAVQTRSELDLRSGYAFTRLLTDTLKKKRNEKSIISYGSCQFPTLGFVVDRYVRVRSFISEPFWYLSVTTKKNRIHTEFSWTKPHFFDKLSATVLYANCLDGENSNVGIILKKEEKPTTNYKPLPLTTVELQKIAARIFKFTAKDTLKLAEDLYTKGFISYPRTETDKFPAKMDLKQLIEKQTEHEKWGEYSKSLLNGKYRHPRGGRHSDEAHPPIHPVNFTNGQNLSAKEKKIHDLVVCHFLACCSDDAIGSMTTVTLKWVEEIFTTSALEVKQENYLEIYSQYRTWKSSAKKIPSFELNEQVVLHKAELKEGKTSPPTFLTEPELIGLMDANGIGTDATIADHIDKIKTREYVSAIRQGNRTVIVPSELGMGLILGFENMEFQDNLSLTKPFLRKNLELDLSKICEGKATKNEILNKMIEIYKEAYHVSSTNKQKLLRAYQDAIEENS